MMINLFIHLFIYVVGGGPHDFSSIVPLVLIWVLNWVDWVGVGPRGFGTGLDNWHTIRGKSQAEKSDQQIKSKAALPQSDC